MLIFTEGHTNHSPHNVHKLAYKKKQTVKVIREVRLLLRRPQSPTVLVELLRTTCWSESSFGSGHVTGPVKTHQTHKNLAICQNEHARTEIITQRCRELDKTKDLEVLKQKHLDTCSPQVVVRIAQTYFSNISIRLLFLCLNMTVSF